MGPEVPKFDRLDLAGVLEYSGIKEAVIPVTKPQPNADSNFVRLEKPDEYSSPDILKQTGRAVELNTALRGADAEFKDRDPFNIFNYQNDDPEDVGKLTQSHVAELNRDYYTDLALNDEPGLRRPPAYFDTKNTGNSQREENRAKSSLEFDTLA